MGASGAFRASGVLVPVMRVLAFFVMASWRRSTQGPAIVHRTIIVVFVTAVMLVIVVRVPMGAEGAGLGLFRGCGSDLHSSVSLSGERTLTHFALYSYRVQKRPVITLTSKEVHPTFSGKGGADLQEEVVLVREA